MKLTGGCLCGAVRYAIDGTLIDAGYCHCCICQRASGAPITAWLTLPVTGFTYTQGRATIFHSSEHSQREFCATCGSPLVFKRSSNPKHLDVTLGSLDDNSRVRPHYHIWTQSSVEWLDVNDDLPRYQQAGPDIS
jgi:hypothetical protein